MNAPADSARVSLAGHTVLVIDDSAAVRTAFEVLLALHGARVVGAADPNGALELLQREEVHLVIQDMNFRREATSGAEGVRLFREIRARAPGLPIILLTAWTHLETAVELVRSGASDYIAKPWEDARLITTVRNLLDLRSARAAPRPPARRPLSARRALRSEGHRLRERGHAYAGGHGNAGGARGSAGADHRA
jgi:DNA-binding NtrC family response regulator